MKTLKNDLIKVRCYLTGHKIRKTLTAGFPFGISLIPECERCGIALGWLKFSEMKADDAREIIKLLDGEKIRLSFNTDLDHGEVLMHIRAKLSQLIKGKNR